MEVSKTSKLFRGVPSNTQLFAVKDDFPFMLDYSSILFEQSEGEEIKGIVTLSKSQILGDLKEVSIFQLTENGKDYLGDDNSFLNGVEITAYEDLEESFRIYFTAKSFTG